MCGLKIRLFLLKYISPFYTCIYTSIVFAMKLYFHNYFFSKIKSMQFWIFFLPTLFKSIALRCLLLIQDKLWDQIHVEVRDFRYYVQPLIFQDSFHDFNLHTGDNILSQNWRQRRLTSQFNSSNDFRSSSFLCFNHSNTSTIQSNMNCICRNLFFCQNVLI